MAYLQRMTCSHVFSHTHTRTHTYTHTQAHIHTPARTRRHHMHKCTCCRLAPCAHRCNYYRFTEDFIYNSLNEQDGQNVTLEDTAWYAQLGALSPRSDPRAQEIVDVSSACWPPFL